MTPTILGDVKMCEHLKAKIELYKTHLDKLWVAFIANGGGIGTLLFKGGSFPLFIAAFFIALILLVVIFTLHHKIERLINKLKLCEERQ
ncbi:MAG TPA: hypothetical protein EYO62_02555 [Aquificales bacterium]|nr:hypothetical protein [Aquificales bacterium]